LKSPSALENQYSLEKFRRELKNVQQSRKTLQ